MDTMTMHAAHQGASAAATGKTTAVVVESMSDPDAALATNFCAGITGDGDPREAVASAARSTIADLITTATNNGTTPFTGAALDTAACWVGGDVVTLWITGDTLAVVEHGDSSHTVHGCEESHYGIDAEAAYSAALGQGIAPDAAHTAASIVRQRDHATTNTPAGRARFTDICDPVSLASGGSWIEVPASLVSRVVLLSPGAARVLAAGGYTSPPAIMAFCADASGFDKRFGELWNWVRERQDGDPQRHGLPRLADITGAAVAVLPVT